MRDEFSPGLVQDVQARAARALPVHHDQDHDGWWMRYSPGPAWWESATLPHGDIEAYDLVKRVEIAEKFYAAHDAGPRFQINPGACPPGLDALLAERGYRFDGPVQLRIAETAEVQERLPRNDFRIDINDQPSSSWLEDWSAAYEHDVDAASEWDMLRLVELPSAFVRVTVDGAAAAVGRAVRDTGWAGVFNLATLPEARGKGTARAALAALAHWAHEHHSGHMYLQVTCRNTAALRLYERAGFREVVRYHYRTYGL